MTRTRITIRLIHHDVVDELDMKRGIYNEVHPLRLVLRNHNQVYSHGCIMKQFYQLYIFMHGTFKIIMLSSFSGNSLINNNFTYRLFFKLNIMLKLNSVFFLTCTSNRNLRSILTIWYYIRCILLNLKYVLKPNLQNTFDYLQQEISLPESCHFSYAPFINVIQVLETGPKLGWLTLHKGTCSWKTIRSMHKTPILKLLILVILPKEIFSEETVKYLWHPWV